MQTMFALKRSIDPKTKVSNQFWHYFFFQSLILWICIVRNLYLTKALGKLDQ